MGEDCKGGGGGVGRDYSYKKCWRINVSGLVRVIPKRNFKRR